MINILLNSARIVFLVYFEMFYMIKNVAFFNVHSDVSRFFSFFLFSFFKGKMILQRVKHFPPFFSVCSSFTFINRFIFVNNFYHDKLTEPFSGYRKASSLGRGNILGNASNSHLSTKIALFLLEIRIFTLNTYRMFYYNTAFLLLILKLENS